MGLPHNVPLKNDGIIRADLSPVIASAEPYSNMRSSQQCEHANREVSFSALKSLHYGDPESLDFRIKATAACTNEGRNYICQVHKAVSIYSCFFFQNPVTCFFHLFIEISIVIVLFECPRPYKFAFVLSVNLIFRNLVTS